MRLDYHVDLSDIQVPRFAVEAQEGIGKLFTLATLVLNVLDAKPTVEIVFHGLNREDPGRRIAAFQEIMGTVRTASAPTFEAREAAHIAESSTHYQWLLVKR